MAHALVSIGANLGDRAAALDQAISALREQPEIQVASLSSLRETAAVGGPGGQPNFLNGAALLQTALGPHQLLGVLQGVEQRFGRRREIRWDARTLDLDLLLYDEQVIDDLELTVPHPRMAFRRFVLEPAAEAAPAMRHPLIQWTVAQLLEHLNAAPNYLAITGVPDVGKTELARHVAAATGAAFCGDPGLPSAAAAVVKAADDPTAIELEIALVEARAAAIQRRLEQSPQGAVSDFWTEQSAVYFQTGKETGEPNKRLAELETIVHEAPAPKLLVFLDAGSQRDNCRGSRVGAPNASRERLGAGLHSRATRPGRGPFFVLDAADRQRAKQEASAAMLAMR